MKTEYIIRATRPGEQNGISIEGADKALLRRRFLRLLEEIGLDKKTLDIKLTTSRPSAKKKKA